ncbi:MAG: DUF4350 domain-containing protein [Proteobacteria bacterium]|nr:DUF4350 domain-containing protein [Pseudomonadota bacterium]
MSWRSPQTRRIVGLFACALLVALVLGPLDAGRSTDTSPRLNGSSLGSQPLGCKAAYLALEGSGYSVRRFRRSWSMLPERAVLVSLSPSVHPDEEEWKVLTQWISSGGVALVSDEVSADASTSSPTEWEPLAVSAGTGLSRGLRRLEVSSERGQAGPPSMGDPRLDAAAPIVVSGTRTLLSCASIGKGALLRTQQPEMFTNCGIARSDNLRLLLNTLGPPGREVLFDEYHHGEVDDVGLWSIMPGTVRLGAVIVGLAGLLLVWALSRRFGAPLADVALPHERTEYVDGMAMLLERASAVELVSQTLRGRFTRRMAHLLSVDLTTDLAVAAASRNARFGERVRVLLQRTEGSLTERELVVLAHEEQQLYEEAKRLS